MVSITDDGLSCSSFPFHMNMCVETFEQYRAAVANVRTTDGAFSVFHNGGCTAALF